MTKVIALTVLLCAVFYYDADQGFFNAYLLPLLGLIAFVHLFTIPGSLILLVGAVLFYFMDMESHSVFEGVVLPLLFGLDLIVFVFWAYKTGLLAGGRDAGGYGGFGGGDSGGSCGGDGGGGDGGGC